MASVVDSTNSDEARVSAQALSTQALSADAFAALRVPLAQLPQAREVLSDEDLSSLLEPFDPLTMMPPPLRPARASSSYLERNTSRSKASVPALASGILSNDTKRILLPRDAQVTRVVRSLLGLQGDEVEEHPQPLPMDADLPPSEYLEASDQFRNTPNLAPIPVSENPGIRIVNPAVNADEATDSVSADSARALLEASPEVQDLEDDGTISTHQSEDEANSDRVQNHLTSPSDDQSRVFDTTKFITVIRGMGGIGKTTLAAMTVSREEVLNHFTDGVAWVKLGQLKTTSQKSLRSTASLKKFKPKENSSTLSFYDYRNCLRTLCKELDLSLPKFEELVLLPGDDEQMREEKELRQLENARQDMTNLLEGMSVLLVIDDLWHMSDLEWFCFGTRPTSAFRLLVTTRLSFQSHHVAHEDNYSVGPASQETIIDVCALSEGEAVQLLLSESGADGIGNRLSNASDARHQINALRIVRGCEYLPVAVRAAGRVVATYLAVSGEPQLAMEQLLSDSAKSEETCRNSRFPLVECAKSGRSRALFDILDRSFSNVLHGPVVATAMKVCFASFAVVFMRTDANRPWIPLPVIHLLWDGLLCVVERTALKEGTSKGPTVQLVETMEALGLLDSTVFTKKTMRRSSRDAELLSDVFVPRYRVHHDSMIQYSMYILQSDKDFSVSKIRCRLRQNRVTKWADRNPFVGINRMWQKRSIDTPMQNQPIRDLHSLIVLQYLKKRRTKGNHQWDAEGLNDSYIYKQLPDHVMKTEWYTVKHLIVPLLQNSGFINGRMKSMGVERGTLAHITNTETMVKIYREHTDQSSKRQMGAAIFMRDEVSSIYEGLKFHLKNESLVENASSSARDIGGAYVAIGASMQRLSLWIEALDLFAEALDVYQSAGFSADSDESSRATDFLNASSIPKLILVKKDSPNRIVLKHASQLRENRMRAHETLKDTDRASIFFSASAEECVPLELSSHPGLAFVHLSSQFRKASFFEAMDPGIGPKEGALHATWRGNMIIQPATESREGAVLATMSWSYNEGDQFLWIPPRCVWTGKARHFQGFDFFISPEGTLSPVDAPELEVGIGRPSLILVSRDSPNRIILEHSKKLTDNQLPKVGFHTYGEEGIPMTLSSHSGCALTVALSRPLKYGGMVMSLMGIGPEEDAIRVCTDGRILACSKDGSIINAMLSSYQVGTPLILVKGDDRASTVWKGGGNDWVVNSEGSISPMHASNLAIGCTAIGKANDIVTESDKILARSEAMTRPKPDSMTVKYRKFLVLLRLLLFSNAANSRADHF